MIRINGQKLSSSNKKIATVSSSGLVKGQKPRKAIITAKVGKKIKVYCYSTIDTECFKQIYGYKK